MGSLEQALQALLAKFFGSPAQPGQAVAGPPTPGQGPVPAAGQPGGPPGVATPAVQGTSLGSLLSILTALGGGYYGMNQLQALQRLYEEQRTNAATAMNPAALAKRAVSATVPLNKQLTYAATRPVDESLALSGLTQAPGAEAAAQTSALAPFAQQNLGLGFQAGEFGFPFVQNLKVPNYLSVLDQLNQFGKNATYSAPSGTPGVGP